MYDQFNNLDLFEITFGDLLVHPFSRTIVAALSLAEQGGLNKKERQLNFHKIFSILIFNELYLFT